MVWMEAKVEKQMQFPNQMTKAIEENKVLRFVTLLLTVVVIDPD